MTTSVDPTPLHELTALDLRDRLAADELGPSEVTEHFLARIEARNPDIGAFALVAADAARERAAAWEGGARDAGRGGGAAPSSNAINNPTSVNPASTNPASIWGLPYGDKELWDRAGTPSRYGSRAFSGARAARPEVTYPVLHHLDAAGGVSLGKTTAPEFGFPAYTEPLAGPVVRNPWDRARGVGGSSGGAAAAVAAGLVPFAPGSDGGGSIRIPAAACGVVGLKTTRGLVPGGSGTHSLGGLVVDGPIARTVADAALLLEAMLPRDAAGGVTYETTLRAPSGPAGSYLRAAVEGDPWVWADGMGVAGRSASRDSATASRGPRPLRIGVSTFSAWAPAYDVAAGPEALAALDVGVAALAGAGHDLMDTQWVETPEYASAFRAIWMAGAAALPIDDPESLALLEPLTEWLVRRGREVSARELVEALTYVAGFERAMIAQIGALDAVILPALAMTPRPLGWFDAQDPDRNFAQQCQYTPYTSQFNVAGLPAITVPTHWTARTPAASSDLASGLLPMGVQIVGRPGAEHTILALAAQLEAAVADQRPPFPL